MYETSKKLVELCTAKNIKIAVAESCTGGMVSAAITDIPGSSKVFDRGFITYSYEAKSDMLKVRNELMEGNGAVSSIVAAEMVIGVIKKSNADIAISITGIAGPAAFTSDMRIGLMCFATYVNGEIESIERQYSGDRNEIRQAAAKEAIELLLKLSIKFKRKHV